MFYKNYFNKAIAILLLIDNALLMARLIVKPNRDIIKDQK